MSTIVIAVVDYPQFALQLIQNGFFGDIPGCISYCGAQEPNLWSALFVSFEGSHGLDFNTVFDYTGIWSFAASAVPEPSTWALLLFGFAFVALKGIWPESRA